jgi:hypothetical protein
MPDPDIIGALHDHDRRLVAVEVEVRNIHGDLKTLAGDVRANAAVAREALNAIARLSSEISAVASSQKILLWVLGLAVPALVALEAWSVLG